MRRAQARNGAGHRDRLRNRRRGAVRLDRARDREAATQRRRDRRRDHGHRRLQRRWRAHWRPRGGGVLHALPPHPRNRQRNQRRLGLPTPLHPQVGRWHRAHGRRRHLLSLGGLRPRLRGLCLHRRGPPQPHRGDRLRRAHHPQLHRGRDPSLRRDHIAPPPHGHRGADLTVLGHLRRGAPSKPDPSRPFRTSCGGAGGRESGARSAHSDRLESASSCPRFSSDRSPAWRTFPHPTPRRWHRRTASPA